MKKGLLTIAVVFAALVSSAKVSSNDPVLLKIDNRETRLSEFEYLYNKNNQQQGTKQSPEEYLDMFVTYKLKVADAISAGIDTTAAFVTEYDKYRIELAQPYLTDKATQEQLIREAYSRMEKDVDVSHIMMAHSSDTKEDLATRNFLDSIRTDIINGKVTWDAMVLEHSIDPAVRRTGNGDMGFITGNGMFPEPFETAAFTTPVGEISPVIDSGFGYHIVRVNATRPAKGQVLVEHILKLTQGMPAEQAAKQKEAIDSIYNVLIAGADFNEVAKRESEDPGSARNGGKLDWFGSGRMVKPFEEAAFSAQDGEITKPFATSYGYHIIHKLDHKGIPTIEEARKELERQIMDDGRSSKAREAKVLQLKEKYAPTYNEAVMEEIYAACRANEGYDSIVIAQFANDARKCVTFNTGDAITVSELFASMPVTARVKPDDVKLLFVGTCGTIIDKKVVNIEINRLPEENTEYRNLLNEYHDGILLFEISNRNVWEKASKDKDGLNKFFRANKDKYTWNAPKFKGYIIFATSDSIRSAALGYLAENIIDTDTLVKTMRKQFGKDVKVEKVIAAEGENAIVDAVGFGKEKPENNGRWAYYFPYAYSILSQPEEATDVRGAVIADYQAYLENEWVAQLRATHKCKVNKKALKQLK